MNPSTSRLVAIACTMAVVPVSMTCADITVPTSYGAGADTNIRGGVNTSENNGSATSIQATTADFAADFRRAIYLKFDLSGLTPTAIANATGAELDMFNAFNAPTGTHTIRIYGVNDSANLDGWAEGAINATNAPAISNASNVTLNLSLLSDLGTLATDQGDASTGAGVAYPTFTNAALLSFLQSDTDGLVTFIIRTDSIVGGSGNFGVRSKEFDEDGAGPIPAGTLAPTLTIKELSPAFQKVAHPQDQDAFTSGEDVFVQSTLLPGMALDRVAFSINGNLVGEDTESPYEWVFPAGSLANGNHVIRLTGYLDNEAVETIERTFTVGGIQELAMDFVTNPSPRLTDWGTAGYRGGEVDPPYPDGPVYDVTAYGAVPDDGAADTVAVQAAINAAQAAGGGVVFFPPGQFDFWVPTSPNYGDILKVSGSNIILRGSGPATILKQRNTYTDIPNTSFTRYHLIRVGTSLNYQSTTRPFASDAPKHATSIVLNSNADIAHGDILQLDLISPNDEGGSRLPDLILDLCAPMTEAMIEDAFTNFLKFNPYRFRVEVTAVEGDGQTAHLATPLPRAMTLTFGARARILGSNLVRECGVENMVIEGTYNDATYSHHASWEADYGWCGVGFFAAAHSWLRDVTFIRMNNDVLATASLHCTIERTQSTGRGHYGVQLNDSTSCLIRDVVQNSLRTHGVSLIDGAIGNVFTGFINATSSPGQMDFHGSSPSIANLFEDAKNFRIASGGAVQNMPHCGQHNTFWNIEAGTKFSVEDMFSYGYYNYSGGQSIYTGADLHQLHPASLLVGIVRPGGSITIDGSTADRDNGWLYVDSVGTKVIPQSLYQFQRRWHDSRLDFPRWKRQSGIPANASDSTVLPGATRSILTDWATGGTPPTAQHLAGGDLRFSFPVRTGDVMLRSRLEWNADLTGPWQEVPAQALSLHPAVQEDFSLLELDVTPDAPKTFYRAAFWRAEPCKCH